MESRDFTLRTFSTCGEEPSLWEYAQLRNLNIRFEPGQTGFAPSGTVELYVGLELNEPTYLVEFDEAGGATIWRSNCEDGAPADCTDLVIDQTVDFD